MRLWKLTCLTALAALAMVAFAGVGSASAAKTAVCKENQELCEESQRYSNGTDFEALSSDVEFLLKTSMGDFKVVCKSTIYGEITGNDSEPAQGTVSPTFSNCTENGVGCEGVKATENSYEAAFSAGEEGNGTLSLTSKSGNVRFTLGGCNAGLYPESCQYGAKQLDFGLAGGEPAHFSISSVGLNGVAENCGPAREMSAEYAAYTEPVISPPATAICGAAISPCTGSTTYPVGSKISGSLQSETQFVLKALGGTVTCDASAMQGEITVNPGAAAGADAEGEITSATWGNCVQSWEETSCESVTAVGLPWTVHVEQGASGSGTMWIGPHKGGPRPGVELSGDCGYAGGCTYSVNEEEPGEGSKQSGKLAFTGGSSPTATATNRALQSGFLCGGTAPRWSAAFDIVSKPTLGIWIEPAGQSPFYLTQSF